MRRHDASRQQASDNGTSDVASPTRPSRGYFRKKTQTDTRTHALELLVELYFRFCLGTGLPPGEVADGHTLLTHRSPGYNICIHVL